MKIFDNAVALEQATLLNGQIVALKDGSQFNIKATGVGLPLASGNVAEPLPVNGEFNVLSLTGGSLSDKEALEIASQISTKVVLAGGTLQIDEDFLMPVGSVCQHWDLQGGLIQLSNNAELRNTVSQGFIVENGTVDGGLVQSTITSVTASQPNSFTVDSTVGWEVGDQVASSYSNSYLPNSTSRIGGTNPLPDFNRVQSISGNTITLTNQVLSTLDPQNRLAGGTKVFQARFDKVTLGFFLPGQYVFRNLIVQNCGNAYGITVLDDTEQAEAIFENVSISNVALDCAQFEGKSVHAKNFNIDTPLDIAKQNFVWGNYQSKGNFVLENSTWINKSRDAFLFLSPQSSSNATGYCPNVTLQNCEFFGESDWQFQPRQLYSENRSLNWLATSGSSAFLTWNIGRFTATNCLFEGFERPLLGTSFVPKENWNQDEITFVGCNLGASPVVVVANNPDIKPVKLLNCTVRASAGISDQFTRGVRDITLSGGTLKTFVPETGVFEESSTTTTASYNRLDFIRNTSNQRVYICSAGGSDQYTAPLGASLSDTNFFLELDLNIVNGSFTDVTLSERLRFGSEDLYFDKCKIPKAENSEFKPIFENFQQNQNFSSLILLGADPTDSTKLELTDWFLLNVEPNNKLEGDQFQFEIKLDSTDGLIKYGGLEGATSEYRFRLRSIRSDTSVGDTSPLDYRGAFLVDPLEGAIVQFARDLRLAEVNTTKEILLSGTQPQGSDTVFFSAIDGGTVPQVGDWISLNNSGSENVRFHEITAVNVDNVVVRPTLDFDYPNIANSFLIQWDFVY